jgi:hypothetical protein
VRKVNFAFKARPLICELINNHINDLDHCNARRSGVAILLPFDGSK